MTLTKAIRAELADKLTIKAINKHAAKLGSEAESLGKAMEDAHRAHLLNVMPEVPPSRYSDLIRLGVFTSTLSGADNVVYPKRREDGSLTTWSESPACAKIGKVSQAEGELLKGAALKNSNWSKFFDQFSVAVYSHSSEARIYMEPRLSCTLPDFRGRSSVYLPCLEKENSDSWSESYKSYAMTMAQLLSKAGELSKKVAEILWLALKYREEVLDLLNACKTVKQLRELFPEAAALLPAPPEKIMALVPTELAAKVRKQLKEGVPV